MSEVRVTEEQVVSILSNSKIEALKIGEKTTVVHATLPSGFIIVESSSCVDPDNYDHEIGKEICMKRIENEIWKLEGYFLQKSIANSPFVVEETKDIEGLAQMVHDAYLETCKKLGWPVKESNAVPYEKLSEDSKELDRASVRAVLRGIGLLKS